ncbi:MAG: NUDIX hydrolase [Acetobacteraceae bacterium]|nr:NUDIX hydrolase [Acetobacteraceae bacterium]
MPRKPIINKQGHGRQFAALPYARQDGETVVMLVTSRETGRWVLPKGWAEKHLNGPRQAAKEAFEEAGVLGDIQRTSVGSYNYLKQLPNNRRLECEVTVFPLHVHKLLSDWPERKQRERRWFTLSQAAETVAEPELITLLLRLSTTRRFTSSPEAYTPRPPKHPKRTLQVA